MQNHGYLRKPFHIVERQIQPDRQSENLYCVPAVTRPLCGIKHPGALGRFVFIATKAPSR